MRAFKMKSNVKWVSLMCVIPMLVMTTSCKEEQVVGDDVRVEKEPVSINSHIKKSVDQVDDLDKLAINKVEGISNKIKDEITNKVKSQISNIKPINNIENGSSETIIIPLKNIYVIDGDTIHGVSDLGETIKVRMTGIDAPEKSQAMGDLSALSLSSCIKQDSEVRLVAKRDNLNDKYGRYLGKVVAGNTDCNLYQVQKGMAWFYEDFANNLPDGEPIIFSNAQEEARANRYGVWVSNPTAPWEYRESNK